MISSLCIEERQYFFHRTCAMWKHLGCGCSVNNVIKLELDMPERTTYDYDNPSDRARAEADVELALSQFDDDDSPYLSYESAIPAPALSGARPKSARTKHHARPRTAAQ
jgi:hypothetical protein